MCTVTFIPGRDSVYLTSNRDEKHWRSEAIPPAIYHFSSGSMLYPKDGDAGGTWIAAHKNGNAIIFLNGGWVRHTPAPPYRKSRGLVLIELADSRTPYNNFLNSHLQGIEPFTAVIWDDGRLYECRWDGTEKYHKALDAQQPHIWSSVTLYDEAVINRRKEWFTGWITNNPQPTQQEILHFHLFTGDGDSHNDLRMNRDGLVFTVSVTSMKLDGSEVNMQYLDLKNNKTYSHKLAFEKTMVGR